MPYEYPRAGRAAPPGVREEIEEFRSLPTISPFWDKSQAPLLFYVLGSGTNPYLMSKEDACYQDRPVHNQRCGKCSSAYQQVVSGEVVCSQVQGKVSLKGYCRLWNHDRN